MTRNLLAALIALVALICGNTASAANDDIQLCHFTGKADQPGRVLNVSANAASAHVGHGDAIDFALLPGGRCEVVTAVAMTACSKLDSLSGSYTWAIDYYPTTGAFDGVSTGGTGAISGTIIPAGDIMLAGRGVEFTVDELSGEDRGASLVVDVDPTASVLLNAVFPVTVVSGSTTRSTYLVFSTEEGVCLSR